MDAPLATRLLRRLAAESERRGFLVEPQGREGRLPALALTRRESEVLELVKQGKSNRQIAEELTISPGTAKNHVEHIIGKLGVSDRTQAVVKALELGILGLSTEGS